MLVHALTLLFVSFLPNSASPIIPGPAWTAVNAVTQEDYGQLRKAAKGNPELLWELVDWCEARGRDKERERALKDIVAIEPDDKKARELLGHLLFDEQWFTTEKKLAAHKKKRARAEAKALEKKAKAQGWVKYGGTWVDPADVARLDAGYVRAEDGTWMSPDELEKMEAGWTRQDLTWVSPEEEKFVEEGRWKCGDDWLELQAANVYHGELGQWWRIPDTYFTVWSTCDRALVVKAQQNMEIAYRDLVRLFGITPSKPPSVLVVRSKEQYAKFTAGAGDPPLPRSLSGLSSIHGAFFADFWIDPEAGFVGAGVSYWNDQDDVENRYGGMWCKHAAAHSFIDAIDPSREALDALAGGDAQAFASGFWEEKMIPNWLRYGAATYVERYFKDAFVGPDGDPLWARKWSIENLANKGGLESLESMFEMRLTPDDIEGSAKRLNQAGLLVAFILDGECVPVVKEHQKLKAALKGWKKNPAKGVSAVKKAAVGLEKALDKNSKSLRTFAGI